jgi:hypothetical protein
VPKYLGLDFIKKSRGGGRADGSRDMILMLYNVTGGLLITASIIYLYLNINGNAQYKNRTNSKKLRL